LDTEHAREVVMCQENAVVGGVSNGVVAGVVFGEEKT
jgi:hypothetical protein